MFDHIGFGVSDYAASKSKISTALPSKPVARTMDLPACVRITTRAITGHLLLGPTDTTLKRCATSRKPNNLAWSARMRDEVPISRVSAGRAYAGR